MSIESRRHRDGQVPNRDASGSVDPETLEAPLEGEAEGAGALLEFASEDQLPRGTNSPTHQRTRLRPRSAWMFAVSASIVTVIGIAAAARMRERPVPVQAASQQGKLTVNTDPDGADVLIDGQQRGATPLSMMLEAGTHSVNGPPERDRTSRSDQHRR
jgi:hypothetical protein